MFCRETILRPMNMSMFLQTAMFIRPRTILLVLVSTIVRLQDFLLGLLSQSSQMLHLDLFLLATLEVVGGYESFSLFCRVRSPAGNQRRLMLMLGTLNILWDAR